MLDIKFVRENPDAIDTAMANRQTSWDREKFFELDDERRAVITEVEELQATRNAESKKIGALMKEGKKDEAEAAKTAETIGALLSMAVKPGNSSIFVGKKEFEIMKKPGRGTHGHIAILTNNVDRAIYHLGQRGVKFDMDSKNVKDGKTVAIYFADEIAGFAFHLVQR